MKYSKFPQRLLIFSVFLSLFLPVNNFSWANPLPLTEINNSINMAKNLESSPFGGHVHALAINPLTNELFLGARPSYNSQDGGKTWNAIAIPKSKPRANVTSIIIDPRNPEIMYATGHGLSVIKSVDGGKTWAVKNKGLNSDSTEAITIDVYDSNKLYLAVLGDGLYRSQDAGESWQRISDFPKNQEIRTLASVGYPTGMGGIWLYAGVDDGVTKSPDCFCGWDKLANEGLPKKRIYSLASDPQNFQTLYAGTQLGVYKTEDAGKSWHLVKEGITDAIISVNPRNSQQIYAVSSDGQLWLSNNSGNNWEKITP